MATSRGLDVSEYQSSQNWAAHKADGVAFAFAKASEGQKTRDKMFDRHIAGIIKEGLIPGAYHFGWPNQHVAEEAENYIAAVKPYKRSTFMHWLDLEAYTDRRNYVGRTNSEIQAWAAAWLGLVQSAFPDNFVGIYTSGSDIAAQRYPVGWNLWYPWYPTQGSSYERAEKAGQPTLHPAPLIWQFTSKPLDRSIAFASATDLAKIAQRVPVEGKREMQLDDAVAIGKWIVQHWPHDKGLEDGHILVQTALSSTYGHARAAHDGTDAILQALADIKTDVAQLRAKVETLEAIAPREAGK